MDGGRSAVGILERPKPAEPPESSMPPAIPDNAPIGPDAPVMSILSTTRAMRRLAPEPVPDEILRAVVEAATWAPSAGNLQIVEYVVVTSRETMARLAPLWSRVIDEYREMTDAAEVDFGDPASVEKMRSSVEYQRSHFAETPALIVVCVDTAARRRRSKSPGATVMTLARRVGPLRALRLLRAFNGSSARGFGASVYPAVENLLLAARAHGLGATLTTWHLFAEDEFKAVIGIPKDVTTYAIIPIGWPVGRFGRINRRPVESVLHRDRW